MDGFQKKFYCVELDLKRTLRTVGNDSTFYGPPHRESTQMVSKPEPGSLWDVLEGVGGDHDPDLCPASLRAKAGQPNPRFLDADVFRQGRYTSRYRCW